MSRNIMSRNINILLGVLCGGVVSIVSAPAQAPDHLQRDVLQRLAITARTTKHSESNKTVHVKHLTYQGNASLALGNTLLRADQIDCLYQNRQLISIAASGSVKLTFRKGSPQSKSKVIADSATYPVASDVIRLTGHVRMLWNGTITGQLRDTGGQITAISCRPDGDEISLYYPDGKVFTVMSLDVLNGYCKSTPSRDAHGSAQQHP